jgi:hypothetical protein
MDMVNPTHRKEFEIGQDRIFSCLARGIVFVFVDEALRPEVAAPVAICEEKALVETLGLDRTILDDFVYGYSGQTHICGRMVVKREMG